MEASFLYSLYLFGGLLSLRFNSACIVDEDCIYVGERCCKHTKQGKLVEKGLCISTNSQEYVLRCDDVCTSQADCLSPKRCDTYDFRCTTECYNDWHCHHIGSQYVCVYNEAIRENECRMKEREKIDLDSNAFYWILFGAVAIFFCICGTCFKLRKKRSPRGEGVSQLVDMNAQATRTNVQRNGNTETLPMITIESNQSPPEESNSQNIDAVAIGGPPSYIGVGDVPESPPPTYEEAMRT